MVSDWLPETLPEDIDAERALLSTICAPGAEQAAAEMVFQLRDEDFVHPAHRAVFRALSSLVQGNMEVNSLTLKDELVSMGEIGRVGGFSGLIELLSGEEVGKPQVLVDLLRRKHDLRDLVRLGAKLVREAAEETDAPQGLLNTLHADLARMTKEEPKNAMERVCDLTDDMLARAIDRMEGRAVPGIKTGFSRLDGMTAGFKPGNLVIVAARPGVGKTALMLTWALKFSEYFHKQGAFFTLEMTKEELIDRAVQVLAQVSMKEATNHGYDEAMVQKLVAAKRRLDGMGLSFCAQATITVHNILTRADRMISKLQGNLHYLVVDYLALIDKPASKRTDAALIADITRAFKVWAKDRGIPVFLLCQLNREVEHRQNGRPQLSDLRDSGAIEQDADVVLFLHRNMKPAVVEAEAEDHFAELIIAKHRNGPMGTIPLYFEGKHTSFREMEQQTDPPAVLVERDGRMLYSEQEIGFT